VLTFSRTAGRYGIVPIDGHGADVGDVVYHVPLLPLQDNSSKLWETFDDCEPT
jgi:hypothetical protein